MINLKLHWHVNWIVLFQHQNLCNLAKNIPKVIVVEKLNFSILKNVEKTGTQKETITRKESTGTRTHPFLPNASCVYDACLPRIYSCF
jgi:hypothetical protein